MVKWAGRGRGSAEDGEQTGLMELQKYRRRGLQKKYFNVSWDDHNINKMSVQVNKIENRENFTGNKYHNLKKHLKKLKTAAIFFVHKDD